MQFGLLQNKRLIVIGGVLATIVVVVILLLVSNSFDSGKVTISVVVAPSDSTLTVDGQPAKAGRITITKGKHTLKASRQYFADATKNINTKDLDLSKPVYVLPQPNTPEAQQYLKDHPQEQSLYERGTGASVSDTQETLDKNYPILRRLPYSTLDYKVDYVVNADKKVEFNVTLFTSYPTANNQAEIQQQLVEFKNEALRFLRQNGVDIDKEKITFTQG